MKKRNLLFALASGMVMFSACSNDDSLMSDANGNAASDAQQIVLQVANTGDGMKARAGRPLYSSEAGQKIDNVQIVICQDNQVKFTTTLQNWNTNKVSQEYANGREAVIQIPDKNKLAPGTYKVYAFGYSNGSSYEEVGAAAAAIVEGGTFKENPILNLKKGQEVEEIFAGDIQLTVEQKGKTQTTTAKGFKKLVVLNRQVAGAFTYVKDIPYFKDAAKLRLVAATRNQHLVLGHFANIDLESNGGNSGKNVKYVVNGTNADANNKVLYEVALNKWFTEIKDENNDNIIDLHATGKDAANDKSNWIGNNQENLTNERPNYAIGSVFGGQFVIPFQKVEGTNSLELQLTDNNNTVLRKWVIKLPLKDQSSTLTAWNGNAFADVASYEENGYMYSIVRNHLYGVGKRTANKPTNPDIEEPGTNEPESLNNKQELILRVNENWEVIHNMEIE